MMPTESILAQIDTAAADMNGLVVHRAISAVYPSCPDCKYPRHASYFAETLGLYIQYKKEAHREAHTMTSDYSGENEYECREAAKRCRVEIRRTWPCQSCIERYNPTNKAKYDRPHKPPAKEYLI